MPRWFKKSTKKRRSKAKPRVVKPAGAQQRPRARVQVRKRRAVFYKRRGFWIAMFKLAVVGAILAAIAIAVIVQTLPDVGQLAEPKKQRGIQLVSEGGTMIASYGEMYGEQLAYRELPKELVEAVLATEDRRFFAHHGIDVWGILRAAIVNARAGRVVQGGSTVTQQLAKNMFLTPERTLMRKLQEVVLAFYLEGRYSKQEIMSIYLNRVYLGAGSYGIDAAAKRYFGKSAREMNLVESAMLTGLLKAPSRYAPTSNSKRARERTLQVLVNMEDAGFLSEAEVKQAMTQLKDSLTEHTVEGSGMRYFTDWVVDTLPNYIGDVDEDIIVTTTIGPKTQGMAEEAVAEVMATEGPAKNISQAALVAMSPDGAVRAMVGGINYGSSQYNRAAQAKRQAGSTFKLFVYLAGLEAGYTPQSLVLDAPITLKVGNKSWSPRNFTKGYQGEISMADALRQSINTAAVRISQAVGIYKVASLAKRMGIADVHAAPSIALGAEEVSLVEITGAFAHLPNNGRSVQPYGIMQIATTKGEVLYRRGQVVGHQVISPSVVEMMNYMLKRVVQSGTGTRAALPGREAAGKTGTSQDFKDAWFMGFVPQLATGVWVGNDDNKPMKQVTGGNVPAMIWKAFMVKALDGLPAAGIPASDGSGGLFNWFGPTNVPDEYDVQGQAAPQGQPLPDNVPFGYANPPQPQPQPAPQQGEDQVLGNGFWNKLMEGAENNVEYRYPDGR